MRFFPRIKLTATLAGTGIIVGFSIMMMLMLILAKRGAL